MALSQLSQAELDYTRVEQEELTPEGGATMTWRVGCLRHLAGWLLPLAGQITVVSPPALAAHLRELAQAAHQHFCPAA